MAKRIAYAPLALAAALAADTVLAQETDFSIVGPPPAFETNDVINPPGTALKIKMDLPAGVVVDAFSYGDDRVEPLNQPGFWSAVQYSVSVNTQGLQSDGRPGAGAVWRQAQSSGNGAGGDKFYLKATRVGGLGMWPVARGISSDAPMHQLVPRLPGPETELDGLSLASAQLLQRIYFSIRESNYPGQAWGPADILVVDVGMVGGVASTIGPARLWASAAQLGLGAGDNIDALALLTSGTATMGAADVVWVSLTSGSPTRTTASGGTGDESVLMVFPGPVRVVFNAAILNLRGGLNEELDALTAFDPGPLDPEDLPPPPQRQEKPK